MSLIITFNSVRAIICSYKITLLKSYIGNFIFDIICLVSADISILVSFEFRMNCCCWHINFYIACILKFTDVAASTASKWPLHSQLRGWGVMTANQCFFGVFWVLRNLFCSKKTVCALCISLAYKTIYTANVNRKPTCR